MNLIMNALVFLIAVDAIAIGNQLIDMFIVKPEEYYESDWLFMEEINRAYTPHRIAEGR